MMLAWIRHLRFMADTYKTDPVNLHGTLREAARLSDEIARNLDRIFKAHGTVRSS